MSCIPLVKLCKKAGWSRRYTFDLSGTDEVRAGETVDTATITATPSGLTVGSTVVSSPYAQAQISGGTAGTTYTVSCSFTTSGGATLTADGLLEVE